MTAQALSSTAHSSPKSRIGQRLFRTGAQDSLPITIRHERIYILPTTRGLAFLCVLAIMLMASINYGLNLGYALCFILVGLFSACLLATYKNLVGIQFATATVDHIFQGNTLQYKIKLGDKTKRQRSSISISTENASDTVDIEVNSAKDATLNIKEAKRGIHTLGRITLSSDFPLGLWRGWGYIHTPVKAYVYPKPEQPVAKFSGSNTASDGSPAVHAAEQEYAGLKSYETTDSPSQIAWKKVASGAGWYSKKFETHDEQLEIAIRWSDTPGHMDIEQRLSRMCGWVNKAVDENSAFTFELPGSQPSALASGREHGLTCLQALAAYSPEDDQLAK